MGLKLLADHVAIIPMEDPIMKGGIYIDQVKQRIDQGIIKYRGPACLDLRVGDHVLFSGYAGSKVSVEGEGVLFIMSETDVDCIVDDDEPNFMFPKEVIDRLLGESFPAILQKTEIPMDELDYAFEIIRTKFNDYVRERGFEF